MKEPRLIHPWSMVPENGAVYDTPFEADFSRVVSQSSKRDDRRLDAKDIVKPPSNRLPEVVVYYHSNYGEPSWRTNIGYRYVGDYWNDKISSIVVVSGRWIFYEHADFWGEHWSPVELGPGYYPWVESVGIPNDSISSFKPVSF